jgi:hypothetical protein
MHATRRFVLNRRGAVAQLHEVPTDARLILTKDLHVGSPLSREMGRERSHRPDG